MKTRTEILQEIGQLQDRAVELLQKMNNLIGKPGEFDKTWAEYKDTIAKIQELERKLLKR